MHDLASWGATAGVSGVRPWAPDVFIPGWGGFSLFAVGNAFPVTARKGIDGVRSGAQQPDANAFHD